jgi:putative ABC transport system permease protein
MHDFRFALRTLAKSPLHATTVILILALGIGANTAIFSLIQSVLLNPLPYPDSDRIVLLNQRHQQERSTPFSWPNYQDVRAASRSFASMGLYQRGTFTLTGRGAAQQTPGAAVEADFFRVLGLAPLLGRTFTADEDQPGGPAVVVLRETLWRQKFNADPAVIGQLAVLGGTPHTIIGVLPDAVISPTRAELWVPIGPRTAATNWQSRRNQPGIFALARLKEGVTVEQAEAELRQIGLQLRAAHPQDCADTLPHAEPLLDVLVGGYRGSLWMLMGAVGLLLVIACANVASLQFIRSLGRTREFSIRAALGSDRARLVRLLLAESLVLSVIGGGLGVLLAFWGLDAIRAMSPAAARFQTLAIDARVLGFSLGVSLLTGIAFGLWPAWRVSRTDLREALQDGGSKGASTAGGAWGRQALVALQVALTVMLLAGAGLFARSLAQIRQFQWGFDPSNLLVFRVSVPESTGAYSTEEKRVALFERLRREIAALPGVRSVGLNYSGPLRTMWSTVFDLEGRPAFDPANQPGMEMGIVDEHYFATLGLPILRGRNFDATDKAGAPTALIIDQRFAEAMWPGEDPIGKVVLRGLARQPIEERRCVVVGVVPTIALYGLERLTPYYQAYLAQSQAASNEMFFFVRTDVAPRSLVESARAAIAAVDAEIPVYSVDTMDGMIAGAHSTQSLYSRLVVLFAAVALLLAALGLYGVVAHAVNARRREIGIRMALGALQREVVRLILRQGLAPLAAGLALGLLGAVLGGRVIRSLLYQTSPADPVSLVLAGAALTVVGCIALYLPARRAAKVDPMVVLRSE